MAKLIYGGLICVALVLQSTVFAHLAIGGVVPDLILILVVILSLFNGRRFGLGFGFAAGLALDALVGQLIGLNALSKMVVGFTAGLMAEKVYKENYVVPFFTVFVATWLDQFLYLLGSLVFGLSISWRPLFFHVIWPLGFYNAALTLLVYLRLYFFNRQIAYWDEMVRRSG